MEHKLIDIIREIEAIAPLSYQESYDNAGLQIGNAQKLISSALLCVDVTEEVVDEAIANGSGLIISHHPLIFGGIKKITGDSLIERCIIKAIQHKIAIYSAHTNMDATTSGVNSKICEKIGLVNTKILSPVKNDLCKFITFVPENYAEKVRNAIFEAGGGCVGNYDMCSYNLVGTGTYRGNEQTKPFIGEKGVVAHETEVRIEIIFPRHLQSKIIKALVEVHPYEEVAFDIIPLLNTNPLVGFGMIGELQNEISEDKFLEKLKKTFNCSVIKHSQLLGKNIKKVAVCGGSGISFLKDAMQQQADIFITGDIKYHDYFMSDNQIIIADIGHYESEFFTKELFYDILTKKITNFAFLLSNINTNPIKYL